MMNVMVAGLLAAVSMQAFAVTIYTNEVDGVKWVYSVSDGKATLGGGSVTGPKSIVGNVPAEVVIPSNLAGNPVTCIGDRAFRGCTNITSVTIPGSVKDIGRYAFSECYGLTSVTIAEGVESIGDCAFAYCNELSSIIIPNSVTSVGGNGWGEHGAFCGCKKLADENGLVIVKNILHDYYGNSDEVIIPEGVTHICSSVFAGCDTLVNIHIPAGVTGIGESAFSGCSSLTSVKLPDSVEWLGLEAFDSCSSLTNVVIGSGLTSIDYTGNEGAFEWCSALESFQVSEDNQYFKSVSGLLLDKEGTTLIAGVNGDVVIPDGVTGIEMFAFYGRSGLTSLTIPESVTWFGWDLFYGCTNLLNVTVTQNVLDEGFSSVFYEVVDSITNVTLSSDVGNINPGAFQYCRGLASITIPNSVTNIDNDAFFQCDGLTNVEIPGSVVSIGEDAFYGCDGLQSVTMHDGVTSIGSYAFGFCKSLTSVSFPEGITNIGDAAFSNCEKLNSVCLPYGLTKIPCGAFSECHSLTNVIIPNTVTEIYYEAFEKCGKLTSIIIPDSVTGLNVGGYSSSHGAFAFCTSLTNVMIGSGLSVIGTYDEEGPFDGCSALKSFEVAENNQSFKSVSGLLLSKDGTSLVAGINGDVVIPDGVAYIETCAFWGYEGLTSVTIPSSVEWIDWSAFGWCTNLANVTIPQIVLDTGFSSVFYGGVDSITNVTLSSDVGNINPRAFQYCSGLASITIPNSVTNIGNDAFSQCDGLANVDIPGSVVSIGSCAFNGCDGLQCVTMHDGVTSIGSHAFSLCKSLTSVSFPAGITNIGDEAFSDCEKLNSVYLPYGLTKIPCNAFSECHSLTNVIIPNTVTEIYYGAFANCSNLTSIIIPDSVTSLNEDVHYFFSYGSFAGCTSLTNVTIGKGLEYIVTTDGVGVFDGCSALKSFEVAEDNPFYKSVSGLLLSKDGTTLAVGVNGDVMIPDGVTIISDYAFSGYTGLTSVTIPASASVMHVENDAFWGCSSAVVRFAYQEGPILFDGNFYGVIRIEMMPDKEGSVFAGWIDVNGRAVDLSMLWRGEVWPIMVPGEKVAVHSGTITTNETWGTETVHLVSADVTVVNGVSLSIEPGAVIKFISGTSLIVEKGATCTGVGVVFTHVNDDTIQGDTLNDGETPPVQDSYKIIGNVINDDTTEYRYMAPQELPSSVTSNIRLRGHRVYVVSNDVTVASGATLTIQPGAILKFASGKSLTVNSGGTLNAQGTRALPIVFTSLKDDTVGGDTNGDGDLTHGESGDWARIYVGGTVNMNYCTIRYCNNNSDYGAIHGRGGMATFDNGIIEYSVYECVRMSSGRFISHNSVFREASMGFGWYAGSGIYVYNGVVADCTIGCRASGKFFYNTVFYRVKTFFESTSGNCSHCVFYNSDERGYEQSCLLVGSNGNIWGDPLFIDPNNGDFRLRADSPCVDAGDAAYAPKTDYFGQKRVTVVGRGDPTAPEGDGDGGPRGDALPDIGIHEVMPREVKSDVDLAVESVVAPESFTVGEKITVTWNVKNIGSETASGTWSDKVELVCANGSAVELGTVTTSAALPADGVQTFSGTFTVPSAQVGAVRVRVTANANRDIFEGTLTANNVAESAATTLTMPELAFPDSGVASFNVAAGGNVGYRLGDGFAEGGLLIVHVSGSQGTGRPTGVNVWTGNGQVPTADIFYAAAIEVGGGDYLVRVPAGGDAYVSFANGGSGLAQVEVGTETGAFLLFDTGVITAPNVGAVTLTLFGNGFEDGMEVCLVGRGDPTAPQVQASEIVVFDPVKAVTTFDVTGLAAGEYEVHVKKGGVEDAASLLALTETRLGPKWSCKLDVASNVRSSREYVGYLEYSNTGDMPLDAPYVKITAGSGSFIRFGTADAWGDTLELMAVSETYPASQLKPGETRRIPFRYKTTASSLSIECGYTQEDKTAFPWDTNAAYMRPSWASDELWGLALAVLKSNVGMTWNDYLARMRANCDHLAKIGQPTYRLDRIWQLEINEALGVDHAVSTLASNTDLARSGRGFGLALSRSYGSGLYRRLRKGIFGYGWSDNYSAYAELQNSGATLALHSGSGSTYLFEKVNGKWTPEDARDKTTCTESSSEYVLAYRSGTVQRIAKSNMRVSSVTDNQGNSLTFTYNADKQLVKVAHCDGQSLSFTYAGGLLASATDDQGRTTRYEYSGDLLVKVTAFNGLATQYRYLPADGAVTSRALSQIRYADGTTRDYTYDGAGRVATVSINGNLQTVEIERGALGSYAVYAPNGGATTVTLGASGEVLETVNALGQKSTRTYTADTLLEAVVGPTGKRAKIAYDEDGQAVKATDAAGADTHFGYTSDFGNLAKVTDARGNSFDYGYDKLGRSKSISYADGSVESIAYNDRGDVTNSVNRRGQSIAFTYDREGNTLSKVWDDGRTFPWAYDAKGNCTNATDSITGTVTMEYDENERLVRIVHPKGRGFAYTYDALGRTTSRTTLVGRGDPTAPSAADIQRYEYDALGRLSRMTDGDGNLYVENTYDDTTGWLITQTYGNGTIVSNAYDILGRTIGIYHGRAGTPCPPWLAFFEYAYDAEGRRISQTTAEGVERYTYDTVGQLTDVIYPDGSEEHFTYDAVGNRISRTGCQPVQEETYTANNLNQYTEIVNAQAARSTMEYDLDGNMTRKGDTRYYYDIQNRLVAVTNTTTDIAWSCEYDVFGNRTKVVDHGTAKETLFVQGSLASAVADYDASGSPTARHILLGSVRLADITGTTGVSPVEKRYYHSDGLASTRLLTDANGDTIGTASYRAFGEIRTTGGSRPVATDALSVGWVGTLGVERDDATGLVFMRNRYYDAEQGRFIQMDKIGLEGGDSNWFRYCKNNPIEFSDVSGNNPLAVLACVPVTVIVAASVVVPVYIIYSTNSGFRNAVNEALASTVNNVLEGVENFDQILRYNAYIYMNAFFINGVTTTGAISGNYGGNCFNPADPAYPQDRCVRVRKKVCEEYNPDAWFCGEFR